jgi:cytoskeletal protein CcmA (bactofilin family)
LKRPFGFLSEFSWWGLSKTKMSALLERDLVGDEVTNLSDAVFDPAAYFERWLADVAAAASQPAAELPFPFDELDQDIYVESRIGSNCELIFEGVLHFDGYSLGNVISPGGTLVLSSRGRIEADIDVGTAIIDGAVTGDIKASDRVVLERDARVKGQIFTRVLSMHLGAILDGDCLLTNAESEVSLLDSSRTVQVEEPGLAAEMSLLAADEPREELEEFLLSA